MLGSTLEVRVWTDTPRVMAEAEQRVLAEIERLEAVFSLYDQHSELRRWCRGTLVAPGPDLRNVLGQVETWFSLCGAAFNPSVGLLVDAWRRAEVRGEVPSPDELAAVVRAIARLPFALAGEEVIRVGDCSSLDLNAVAKGYIVDRAAAAGRGVEGVRGVSVSIGGDLVHVGKGSLHVGIEDPAHPFDNAAPLLVVEVDNHALATSGSSRRGFTVAGQWYGHVLDPRSGQPVADVASVTITASDAITADVVATAAGVLGAPRAVELANGLRDVGICLVDAAGGLHRNELWRSLERVI